jgi:hypothetical protein
MFFRNHKYITGFVLASFVFGASAYAGGSTNTPETGYTLCFNIKTRVVTLPENEICGKGTQKIEVAGKNQFNGNGKSEPAGASDEEYTDEQAAQDDFENLCLSNTSGECSSMKNYVTYTKMLLDISKKTSNSVRVVKCKFQKIGSTDPSLKYSSDGYAHVCETSPESGVIRIISTTATQVNNYIASLKNTKCVPNANVLVGYVKTQPDVAIQIAGPNKAAIKNFLNAAAVTTVCPVA